MSTPAAQFKNQNQNRFCGAKAVRLDYIVAAKFSCQTRAPLTGILLTSLRETNLCSSPQSQYDTYSHKDIISKFKGKGYQRGVVLS